MPLIGNRQVIGIISLQNLDHENAFPEPAAKFLSTVAGCVSTALENARLFSEAGKCTSF